MPLPTGPVGRSPAAADVLVLFGSLHEDIRHEIHGVDDDGLNWSAGPGFNSIATLVTHVVGSEAETLRCVAGLPCARQRLAEFRSEPRTMSDTLDELARADALVAEVGPLIDAARLAAEISLPTLSDRDRRPGLLWLIGNYGHAREHLGHIQVTKQLLPPR
jgi:hypothetical protein